MRDDKDVCCPGREQTVIELLEHRKSLLIDELARVNEVIKHFKGTSEYEQKLLMTVFNSGRR